MSKSADFSTLDYEYEVTDTTFYLGKVYWLNSDGTYYWRVRTRSINKEDSFTDVHSFNATYFRMQFPAQGDTCDFVNPTFVCDSVSYDDVLYTFEIASNAKFENSSMVHVGTSSMPRYTLPFDLLASRDYYVKATALFNNIEVKTQVVKFRTKPQFVPVPTITWPTDGMEFVGTDLKIVWKEQPSSGFQVEISSKSNFPPRSTTKIRLEDPTASSTTTTLKAGVWYIRVMAVAEGGYTDPSDVVTVHMGVEGGADGTIPTDVDNVLQTPTTTKVIENGQVYILRNGIRYNILGFPAK